jgi:hypothetical protein
MGPFIEHPATLVVVAILCSPALIPLARFFFDDFETFKAETGLHYAHNRFLWILGWPRVSWQFRIKTAAFIAVFVVLVTVVYLTVCRMLF